MKKVCTTLHFFLVLVCSPVQLVHVRRTSTRIKQIASRARHYGRTLRMLRCKFNPDTMNYDYTIVVAKAGTGTRGGYARGYHAYVLTHLTPEDRALVRSSIRIEPDCRDAVSII